MKKILIVSLICTLLLFGLIFMHRYSSGGINRINKQVDNELARARIMFSKPIGPTQEEPYILDSKLIGEEDANISRTN